MSASEQNHRYGLAVLFVDFNIFEVVALCLPRQMPRVYASKMPVAALMRSVVRTSGWRSVYFLADLAMNKLWAVFAVARYAHNHCVALVVSRELPDQTFVPRKVDGALHSSLRFSICGLFAKKSDIAMSPESEVMGVAQPKASGVPTASVNRAFGSSVFGPRRGVHVAARTFPVIVPRAKIGGKNRAFASFNHAFGQREAFRNSINNLMYTIN